MDTPQFVALARSRVFLDEIKSQLNALTSSDLEELHTLIHKRIGGCDTSLVTIKQVYLDPTLKQYQREVNVMRACANLWQNLLPPEQLNKRLEYELPAEPL